MYSTYVHMMFIHYYQRDSYFWWLSFWHQIRCRDIVLEDTDVAKALIEYTSHSAIENLVVGSSSKTGFLKYVIFWSLLSSYPACCTKIYEITHDRSSGTWTSFLALHEFERSSISRNHADTSFTNSHCNFNKSTTTTGNVKTQKRDAYKLRARGALYIYIWRCECMSS